MDLLQCLCSSIRLARNRDQVDVVGHEAISDQPVWATNLQATNLRASLNAKGLHRLFVVGQRVSIPDKDRVADRHPGTELTYESVI